jgi:RNA polymerase sigma-70 factor (ECF subfamily)
MMIRSANLGTSAAATPSCVDDATLIDRFLRTDDEEVFEILVRRYQDKVFRLAASILGRGADSEAEDAAQEVFVVVLRKLKTFRRESTFSTWLYRLARNQIIDYRRRAARRPSRVSEAALRTVPDRNVLADPQKVVTTAQKRTRLMRHVDRLGEPQRAVVHLHYWQGQSVAEISDLLGLRPGTVKSHLYRARQRLALSLREDGCDE